MPREPLAKPTAQWYVNELKAALSVEKTMPDEQTMTEHILDRVHRFARRRHFDLYGKVPGITVEKVKSDYWTGEDGRALRKVLQTDLAAEPAVMVKVALRKDKDWAAAVEALANLET